MDAVRSPWLLAFGALSLVHLVLLATDVTPWDSITKCVLAPLLAAWVLAQGGPRLLVVALALCFVGDLCLEVEALFTVGMAAFAAGHVCFITLFVQRGALQGVRRRPWIVVVYVAAAVGLVAWAWGGLEADLKPLVPVYAALLLGTASTSLASDPRAGLGGALFLVSDGIIALGEAGRFDPEAAATGLAIMTLYLLAVYLLATGIVRRETRTLAAAVPGFDPTARTDCWPRLPGAGTPT